MDNRNKQTIIEMLAKRIYGNQPLEDYLDIPTKRDFNNFIVNLPMKDTQYLSPEVYDYWNETMQGGNLKAGTQPTSFPALPEKIARRYTKDRSYNGI